MSIMNCNCGCKYNCTGIALVSSLIIGIITAFLRITAVITVTPAFLWVVLGIGVVYLAVTLLTSSFVGERGNNGCICQSLSASLVGVLGTILLSVILLAIEFVATSVIGAIFTGALLFFFALAVSSTSWLIKCIVRCDGKNKPTDYSVGILILYQVFLIMICSIISDARSQRSQHSSRLS